MSKTINPVWPFVKQVDKPHYNEAESISNARNPVWKMTDKPFGDAPITPSRHDPWCGYWPTEKELIPPPVVVTRLYALASGLGGIHGYIINIEDMSIVRDVAYDPAVVSAWPGNTSGDLNWVPSLNRFMAAGTGVASADVNYIYEFDTLMNIVSKLAQGTVTRGTDGSLYVCEGSGGFWSGDPSWYHGMDDAAHQPVTGANWTNCWSPLDPDVSPFAVDTWTLGNHCWTFASDPINANVVYYGGHHYMISSTITRTLRSTGRTDKNAFYDQGKISGKLDGSTVICVSDSPGSGGVAQIDLATLAVLQITSGFGGYFNVPFLADGYAYFAYLVSGVSHIGKLKLSDFTMIDAVLNVSAVGDGISCWLAEDGNLYVSTIQGFYIIDPSDLSIKNTYVGHGARGLAEGKTLDGRSWLFGVEPLSFKIQKYGPLPAFTFVKETAVLVATPTQKITCVTLPI